MNDDWNAIYYFTCSLHNKNIDWDDIDDALFEYWEKINE